ncbi:hypothetical protein ACF1BQ_026925 [Bradyrhizobium sp. RDT10]
MPLNTNDFPAVPECGGKQWSVEDEDELAALVAMVLIGRAKHAESVLAGSQQTFATVPDAIKQQLRVQLHPAPGPLTYHRDGLLFEIISWIAARITAAPDEVISTPHLKSTQQGLDTIKIGFDPVARTLTHVVIHEQKCTQNPRNQFRDNVLEAFRDWKAHKRDNELVQAVTGLVERFNLSDEEHLRLYDRLVQIHPLVFQAALTVTPTPFDTERCVSLFGGYSEITPSVMDRLGDTFPLANVRNWFAAFAQRVWGR